MANWEEVIANPEERKVFEALANPEWDFRTIDGIHRATQLPPEEISRILDRYKGELVQKSDLPDPQGRELYALRTDQKEVQMILQKLRTFLSKSVA